MPAPCDLYNITDQTISLSNHSPTIIISYNGMGVIQIIFVFGDLFLDIRNGADAFMLFMPLMNPGRCGTLVDALIIIKVIFWYNFSRFYGCNILIF